MKPTLHMALHKFYTCGQVLIRYSSLKMLCLTCCISISAIRAFETESSVSLIYLSLDAQTGYHWLIKKKILYQSALEWLKHLQYSNKLTPIADWQIFSPLLILMNSLTRLSLVLCSKTRENSVTSLNVQRAEPGSIFELSGKLDTSCSSVASEESGIYYSFEPEHALQPVYNLQALFMLLEPSPDSIQFPTGSRSKNSDTVVPTSPSSFWFDNNQGWGGRKWLPFSGKSFDEPIAALIFTVEAFLNRWLSGRHQNIPNAFEDAREVAAYDKGLTINILYASGEQEIRYVPPEKASLIPGLYQDDNPSSQLLWEMLTTGELTIHSSHLNASADSCSNPTDECFNVLSSLKYHLAGNVIPPGIISYGLKQSKATSGGSGRGGASNRVHRAGQTTTAPLMSNALNSGNGDGTPPGDDRPVSYDRKPPAETTLELRTLSSGQQQDLAESGKSSTHTYSKINKKMNQRLSTHSASTSHTATSITAGYFKIGHNLESIPVTDHRSDEEDDGFITDQSNTVGSETGATAQEHVYFTLGEIEKSQATPAERSFDSENPENYIGEFSATLSSTISTQDVQTRRRPASRQKNSNAQARFTLMPIEGSLDELIQELVSLRNGMTSGNLPLLPALSHPELISAQNPSALSSDPITASSTAAPSGSIVISTGFLQLIQLKKENLTQNILNMPESELNQWLLDFASILQSEINNGVDQWKITVQYLIDAAVLNNQVGVETEVITDNLRFDEWKNKYPEIYSNWEQQFYSIVEAVLGDIGKHHLTTLRCSSGNHDILVRYLLTKKGGANAMAFAIGVSVFTHLSFKLADIDHPNSAALKAKILPLMHLALEGLQKRDQQELVEKLKAILSDIRKTTELKEFYSQHEGNILRSFLVMCGSVYPVFKN